jgi:predicted ATPase/class 3 adenylate cyclase
MRVCILGTVEVWDLGRRVRPLAPQSCRLLAMLAATPGQTVSSARIAEYVAGGSLDKSAVRTAVSRLRKVLGNAVATEQGGYRLVLSNDDELDAAGFEELVDAASTMRPKDRRDALTRALGLWRGEALAEFADEPWAHGAATRLNEMRALATEDLAETLIELGLFAQAASLLDGELAGPSYRERPVALTMRALAADGRVTEALRVFHRFRTRTREEIGIEPTSELRELEAELLGGLDPERVVEADKSLDLPTGTVTFLFTDVEGSTERWQRDEAAMSNALADHDDVIRTAVESCDGWIFKHTGDGICAVFTSARRAGAAAVEAQKLLKLPVRMGLHSGEAELREGDYYGPTLNRAARIMDAGHGGQILLSAATAELVAELEMIDLGEHRLKGIATPVRVFQLGLGEFPTLRTPRERSGNIPIEINEFVGRAKEISDLVSGLGKHRVVTIVGPGGAGKTRLSLETATAAAATFPDGCWYIELSSVAESEAVDLAFAAGLGLRAAAEGEVISGVVSTLRNKRLLMVVDNCEHVLIAAGAAIETVVRACPTVTVLATSREPLMVTGERLFPLSSLSHDDAQRLFIERASSEAPDLVIDDVQLRAITELCERLDGLPLAIELAASRVRALTPVEIAAALDDRLGLLVGGRRTKVEHHTTMRGTLDWSYELCTEIERMCFDRLSVFPAGFDLDAARAVAAGAPLSELQVIDCLPRLVDRSLVQRMTRPDGTSRYHLLETMRAYGRDHLRGAGDVDAVRHRHADYIAKTVAALSLATIGPSESKARQQITLLQPDCRAACTWFIDQRAWGDAVTACCFGLSDNEREEEELEVMIVEALARAGEVFGSLEDDFAFVIETNQSSISERNRRGWEMMDAGWRARSHRFSYPPHVFIEGNAESGMRPDDLLPSLRQLRDAPTATRFHTEYAVMRNLAIVRPDLAVDHLASFEALTNECDSVTARAMASEVRGLVAWSAREWTTAVECFTAALAANPTGPKQWFEATVSLYRLVAMVLSGDAISGVDLTAPWKWHREADLTTLRSWGAATTSVVLDHLGNADLARQFRRFVVQTDAGGVAELMEMRLAGAGFHLERDASAPVDLEELVDELFEFAASLPAPSQVRSNEL